MDRVDAEGLVVAGANHQLDGFVKQPDEYVNVFHSSRHIERVWGQHFEGIRQIPGYIFTRTTLYWRSGASRWWKCDLYGPN